MSGGSAVDGRRRLRVVLADDHVLLRESLAESLSKRSVEVVGQAGDVPGLMSIVERLGPDVVIVDIRMPPTHRLEGLEAAAALRAAHARLGILVLSHHVETAIAMDLLREQGAGAGYLLKDRVTRIDTLVDAIERVADGGTVIDPDIVGRLLGRQRARGPLDELTAREREVLGLMAEGRSNHGIATALGIEDKTVEYHVSQILGKLGIEPDDADNRRVIAVLAWLREAN